MHLAFIQFLSLFSITEIYLHGSFKKVNTRKFSISQREKLFVPEYLLEAFLNGMTEKRDL